MQGPVDCRDSFRSSPFDEVVTTPNQLRWDPLPIPEEPTDFDRWHHHDRRQWGQFSQAGMAVHIYAFNKGMGDRYFYNADGEMLIVPEKGRIGFFTELGYLQAGAGEVVCIPRGSEIQDRAAS